MAKKVEDNKNKTGSISNVQEGFGGASQWEALEKYALGTTDVTTTPGNEAIAFDKADTPSTVVGEKIASIEESIKRMSEANASMLKGEIPADVSASVRRAASESSIMGGTFGSSARALSARDLGRTSFDIKQTGIANENAIIEAKTKVAAATESIREYNLTRNATLQELSLKAREVNLSAIDLERQRIATNIEANVNILKMISDMAVQQQSIATQGALGGIDTSNIISSLDRMIAEFNKKLS